MLNERHAKLLEARGFDVEILENLGIEFERETRSRHNRDPDL